MDTAEHFLKDLEAEDLVTFEVAHQGGSSPASRAMVVSAAALLRARA